MASLADGSTGWQGVVRAGLAGLILASMLYIQSLYGPTAAYIAMGAMLLCVLTLGGADWRRMLAEPANLLTPAAFVVLVVAFSLSARQPTDVLYAANFIWLLLIPLGSMALSSVLNGRPGAMLVFDLSLGVAVINTLVGVLQVFVEHQARAGGGFNPIYFSNFGVMFGFLALGGLLFGKGRFGLLYAIGPVLGVADAGLGGTRGALVVAAAMAVVFVAFAMLEWPRRRVLSVAAAIVVLAVGLVGIGAVVSPRTVIGFVDAWRQVTTGSGDESTSNRVEFYTGGVRAFLDSPLFGHGWSRRFSAAMPYMSEHAAAGFDPKIFHLHNDSLNMLSGAGLLGLVSYLMTLATPLVAAFRRGQPGDRAIRFIAVGVVASFAVMGLTDSVLVFELPKMELAFAIALVIGLGLPRVAPRPAAPAA